MCQIYGTPFQLELELKLPTGVEVCVRVCGCVCEQVCKSKSCGQLCCHATLMSRRTRPQNLTAKGIKLKKFNEHAYLIKARTHTFEECVAERQVGAAHIKQGIHLGTFVVVLSVATHSVPLFSTECNHKSCQRSDTRYEFIDKPALDTCDTT